METELDILIGETKLSKKKEISCACDNTPSMDTWIVEDGWLTCPGCGFQIFGNLDTSAEYRYYGNEDSKSSDPTRCGLPIDPLLPNSSLSTMISGKNNQLKRLHSWTSVPYKERSLKIVFDIITNACYSLKLNSSVISMSKSIYHSIRDQQLSRGKNRNALISACIYISCKCNEVKILPQEVCDYFKLEFCDLCDGYKVLSELLINSTFHLEIRQSEWNDYLERYCIHLGFDEKEISKVMKLATKINDLSILKKHIPQSFASGVLYYYIEKNKLKHIDKDLIIKVCNISKVTIDKIYAKIIMWSNFLSDFNEN
jgi:transcription initiation factor TFIIIB Brf1 subunit/transcription initiation factor TFIIB